MAHINVIVDEKSDLFTIQLDRFSDLVVNGQPQGGSSYTQPAPGVMQFSAYSSDMQVVNPNSTLYLKGSDGKTTYILTVSYQKGAQTLYGIVTTVKASLQDSQGPQGFSQNGMTGDFTNS